MNIYYDLHIHSCLSPCGDNEMTPNNLVNMAVVNQLDVIALTDHNTTKNCKAAMQVAKQAGILLIAGMELTTSEEIHVICLFPNLEVAEQFDRYVYDRIPNIQNKAAIFGDQLIMDHLDTTIGLSEKLLINATSISIESLSGLAAKFGFFAYPAHIDRESYSILSSLGFIPPELHLSTVEIFNPNQFFTRPHAKKLIEGYHVITSSDAHYLWDIAERNHFLQLKDATYQSIIEYLR